LERIRVYHIDAADEAHQLVRKFTQDQQSILLVGAAKSLAQAMEEINRVFPDVILIDENTAPDNFPVVIQKLLLKSPYLGIIVTTTEHGTVRMKQFMNAGARDYLIKPFASTDLLQSISQVHGYVKGLKKHLVANSTRILTRAPQMITVFSTKGGVGKSTISTLLSAGLASLYRERTVIVDLDLQFGDISLLLDVRPKTTITNVTEAIERLTAEELKKQLVKHSMGVYVLPSPFRPEEEEFITDAALQKMFALLKQEFDYIIVDCPPGFTDQVIVALEQSDFILFVTSPELLALKNTKMGLKTISELSISQEKVKIIVNRFSAKSQFPVSLIEDTLNIPVYETVSNDYMNIIQFLNQGQPQVVFEGKGQVGKDIKRMIEGLRNYHTILPQEKRRKWYWPFGKK